jgi:catechol 2,3-dioxygenase-like lactoylglutathione lyase family enzyme
MGLLHGLHEVILFVEDMQDEVEFYRDMLGLKIIYPKDKKDFSEEHWVQFDTGACSLCLHRGGERRIGEDAPKLVFLVGDISEARDELGDNGVPMSDPRQVSPGIWISDGEDPEGNRFSIEAHSKTP